MSGAKEGNGIAIVIDCGGGAQSLKPMGPAFQALATELVAAESKHPPYNSMHEGLAIIMEEVDELRAVVFDQDRNLRRLKDKDAHQLRPKHYSTVKRALARTEAIQIACTAMRFIAMLDSEPAE